MHSFFHPLWFILWIYGWLSFVGIITYTFLGLIVFWNVVSRTDGPLYFWRFLFLSIVCGPSGWISFPFWFLFKLCTMIEVEQLARWISKPKETR